GGITGALGWTFQVADSALDGLAAGQKLVQTYALTVDDGNGGKAIQNIVITLVGADEGGNHAPVIIAGQATGTAVEQARVTGNNTLDKASGQITFQDVDLTDGHTLSVTPQGT